MYYTHRGILLSFVLVAVVAFSPAVNDFFLHSPDGILDSVSEIYGVQGGGATMVAGISSFVHPLPFPDISSESFFIGDMNSGVVWKEKEPDSTHPIASLTKIATSLLFFENISQNEWYRVSKEAKNTIPKLSSIPEGAFISAPDIIRLMMMESDNDIAQVAAEKIGRAINFEKQDDLDYNFALQATISAMNARVHELGLLNTNFINPIGLDDALQYSSARDLFYLVKYIFENRLTIWHLSRRYHASVVYKNLDGKMSEISITNTNPLIQDYPRIIGSKTGLTDDAGQALSFIYRLKDGRAIGVVLLKSQDRFGDGEKIIQWLDAMPLKK